MYCPGATGTGIPVAHAAAAGSVHCNLRCLDDIGAILVSIANDATCIGITVYVAAAEGAASGGARTARARGAVARSVAQSIAFHGIIVPGEAIAIVVVASRRSTLGAHVGAASTNAGDAGIRNGTPVAVVTRCGGAPLPSSSCIGAIVLCSTTTDRIAGARRAARVRGPGASSRIAIVGAARAGSGNLEGCRIADIVTGPRRHTAATGPAAGRFATPSRATCCLCRCTCTIITASGPVAELVAGCRIDKVGAALTVV